MSDAEEEEETSSVGSDEEEYEVEYDEPDENDTERDEDTKGDEDTEGDLDTKGDEDAEGDLDVTKFQPNFRANFIEQEHPEVIMHNFTEIAALCDKENKKTFPFLTKFEVAKIIGLRAKQLNAGANDLLWTSAGAGAGAGAGTGAGTRPTMNGYRRAQLELRERKIPFILKRPLFGGEFEYWRVADLELLD
jgi:hypothetical protein